MVLLPGLVRFDMKKREFTKMSATKYYGHGTAQRGQMVHLPAFVRGMSDLYIILGGSSSSLTSFGLGRDLVSFSNITLYDPEKEQLYWQTADGQVPRSRESYCAAGAKSTNETFEM